MWSVRRHFGNIQRRIRTYNMIPFFVYEKHYHTTRTMDIPGYTLILP